MHTETITDMPQVMCNVKRRLGFDQCCNAFFFSRMRKERLATIQQHNAIGGNRLSRNKLKTKVFEDRA